MARPRTTKLSNDVTKPQPTKPGDAPADTWDEKERATSVTPDKKAAAEAGHQSVNAVVKSGEVKEETPAGDRTETYTAYDGAGNKVTMTHNYDTGVTSVKAASE
mgnify:FL=1